PAQTKVIVRCVGQLVGTAEVSEEIRRQIATRKCSDPCSFTSLWGEITGVGGVQDRSVDLPKSVTAYEVVAQRNSQGLRSAGTLSSNPKSTAGGSRGRTVFVDDIVGNRNGVISGHVDAVPLVVVDRIVDDVVWAAIGILKGNGIAPVGVE